MLEHVSELTCKQFRGHFSGLMNSGENFQDAEHHPHAKDCAACRQLLRNIVGDMNTISEAADFFL